MLNTPLRPEFRFQPLLLGDKTQIRLANGEVHVARLAIVDLDDLLASHNERTFAKTVGFPEFAGGSANDRNYTRDLNAQAITRNTAQQLEPIGLISDSMSPKGTPIITPDGIVISGNGRTMALKLASQDFPDKYEAYKQLLFEKCDKFGFTSYAVGHAIRGTEFKRPTRGEGYPQGAPERMRMNHPVLVRIDLDFSAYSPVEFAKYNAQTGKAEAPLDRSVKMAHQLHGNAGCQAQFSDMLGEADTFSEFFEKGENVYRLKTLLVKCGLIGDHELPAYFNGNTMTVAGKDLVQQAAAGLVLERPAMEAAESEGVQAFRQHISTSLPVLLKNETLKGFSVRLALNEAVLAQRYLVSNKTYTGASGSAEAFRASFGTQELFGAKQDAAVIYSRQALYLNRLLAAGRVAFKAAIEHLNSAGANFTGNDMFAGTETTFEQAFEAYVVKPVKLKFPQEAGFIEQYVATTHAPAGPPEEELPQLSDMDVAQSVPSTPPAAVLDEANASTTTPVPALEASTLELAQQAFGGTKPMRGAEYEVLSALVDAQALAHPAASAVLSSTPSLRPVARDTAAMLTGHRFYEANPDHILGREVTVSARFTESVTVVRGSLEEALARIPYDLPTAESVGQSVIQPTVAAQAEANPAGLARALKAAKRAVVNKATAEHARATAGDVTAPIYSFEEARQLLNPHLSDAEIECFLWHKRQDRDPWLGGWGGGGRHAPAQATIDQWLTAGICCYDGARYHYAPLFYAGLAAKKEQALKASHAAIVAVIGEKGAAFQLAELERRRPQSFLLTDPNPAHRLQLRASSKFAKGFKIAGLRDQDDYVGAIVAKVDGAWKTTGYGKVPKLLPHAFNDWLKQQSSTEFKEGVNAADVIEMYVNDRSPARGKNDTPDDVAKDMRLMARCRAAGERLFAKFLYESLRPFDQRRIETTWNDALNDFIPVELDKIPVAFRFAKTLKGEVLEVRSEKREQVAMLAAEGSGICAYDVGVGKTYAAIFSVAHVLDAGLCKRPLVVVPNQVYRQFVNEIKALLPHVPLNEFYNLGTEMEGVATVDGAGKTARLVEEGTITVITKEGLTRIGFNKKTEGEVLEQFHDILNQGNESSRGRGALMARLETLIGRGLKDTVFNIEDFGFDFVCHDEAHAAKKVFSEVKGETEGGDRERHSYKIQSGTASSYALRFFMLSQYIRRRNKGRNVLLLTATPFTNSPLEVYSMLALVAYDKLAEQGISSLKNFFDTYVKVSEELVITPSLKPAFKQVVMGFSNLASMQALIRRFINYKTADDVGAARPDKIVLPLLNRREGETLVPLLPGERIETRLMLSPQQQMMMRDVESYINGEAGLNEICRMPSTVLGDVDADPDDAQPVVINEKSLSDEEKAGVRILRGINYARNIALSPYLYPCANLGLPTPKAYVESSPKLTYVMECIRTVRDHYAGRQEAAPGQIIYMDRGVSFFPLLRDYLIYQLGYRPEEIGMIYSGLSADRKDSVKNKFLGLRRNPYTGLEEPIDDAQRIKVLIGSSTIKEGLNLQRLGGFLYNCFVDWNPTDVKQLEGRIWRYGNQYAAVCINTPLMENSIEPFIFQKLQEKTSRINEIWSKPGRLNDLRLEELNPAELKNALITDPAKVAENQINDQVLTATEQGQFFRGRAQEVTDYVAADKGYALLLPEFRAYMATLTLEEVFGPPETEAPAEADGMFDADNPPPAPKPPRVRRMPDWTELAYKKMHDFYRDALYAKQLHFTFPKSETLNQLAWKVSYLKRRVIEDNNLKPEEVYEFHNKLAATALEWEAKAKELGTPERRAELTATITAEREAQHYSQRTIAERVEEFARVLPRIFLKRQAAAAPVVAPDPTPLQVLVKANSRVINAEYPLNMQFAETEAGKCSFEVEDGDFYKVLLKGTTVFDNSLNFKLPAQQGTSWEHTAAAKKGHPQTETQQRHVGQLYHDGNHVWFLRKFALANPKHVPGDNATAENLRPASVEKAGSLEQAKQRARNWVAQQFYMLPEVATAKVVGVVSKDAAQDGGSQVPAPLTALTRNNCPECGALEGKYCIRKGLKPNEPCLPHAKRKKVAAAAAPAPALLEAPGVEKLPASCPPRGADGVPLVDAASLQQLGMCLSLLPQTKTMHSDAHGNYTPERKALHRKIIAHFTRNRPCRTEKPIAVMTGGLPGSGKSHLIKNSPFAWVNDDNLVVHVDADEVRAQLPEFQGWNAAQTHAETKDLVKYILDHIGEPCSHDIVYDGTMNKISSYLPLIAHLKSLGYKIFILFVKVSLATSKERVLARYQKTGRYVPLEVIEEAYHAGDSAFHEIIKQVDGFVLYDGLTGAVLDKGGESIPTSRAAAPEALPAPAVPVRSSETVAGHPLYQRLADGRPVVVVNSATAEADFEQVEPCRAAQYYPTQQQAVCAALHASYKNQGRPFYVYADPKREKVGHYHAAGKDTAVKHHEAGTWYADGFVDEAQPTGAEFTACRFLVGDGSTEVLTLAVRAAADSNATSKALAQAQRIRILRLKLKLKARPKAPELA